MDRQTGPHTHLSHRALFCRFSGLEASALDSRRFNDGTLLWTGGGRGVEVRADFVLVPPIGQLCLKNGL